MKELSLEKMEEIHGGDWCTFNSGMLVLATVAIFAAPFTGGISIGLLAFAMFIGSAYAQGATC
ncbi:MAG: hypothetical protein IIB06_10530 [Bacteroidetes bacterium]|nr:hypothetical protein [Bacteroidota bacterium]